jgi:hypothetical protein
MCGLSVRSVENRTCAHQKASASSALACLSSALAFRAKRKAGA